MLDTRDSDCYEVQVGKAEDTAVAAEVPRVLARDELPDLRRVRVLGLVKLGVRDRTRAALRGLELGLVAEPR